MDPCDNIEDARHRMMEARRALADYVDRPPADPPDRRKFNRLLVRLDIATEEYLSLVAKCLEENYSAVVQKQFGQSA